MNILTPVIWIRSKIDFKIGRSIFPRQKKNSSSAALCKANPKHIEVVYCCAQSTEIEIHDKRFYFKLEQPVR